MEDTNSSANLIVFEVYLLHVVLPGNSSILALCSRRIF